jgi:uncharacterized protein involved in outer membrane biogenesis
MKGLSETPRPSARDASPTRRWPRRIFRWGAGLLGGLLALLAVVLLFRDSIFKTILVQHLRHEFGVRVEIGELKTGLGSTIIHVRDFKVFNAPEFGGSLLTEVPEFFAQLDPGSLSERLIHLKELRVNLSEFNVVRNGDGRTNLEKMQKAWREHLRRKKRKKDQTRWDFGGIDQLQVSLGKIGFTDLHRPALSREFRLDLRDEKAKNLMDEERVQNWAGLVIFRLLAQDSMRPEGERRLPTLDWLLGWTTTK